MNNISRTAQVISYLRSGGARTLGYVASVGVVAGVAARVSYSHIRDITLFAGQPDDVAALLPLAVDGMLLAASLAMAQDKANGREPRVWARIGFWLGAAISLACNTASTIVHSAPGNEWLWLAIFVSILAPALLLITVEIIVRPGKPMKTGNVEQQPAKAPRSPQERLADARKRAGYDKMTTAEKTAWTKRYNERISRNAPASGVPDAVPAGDVPTDAELEAAIA